MSDLNQHQGTPTALKRSLSLPLLIMFGLAYLSPTAVFNYYGIFTESTGGMYTLAFAITTVVMFFTAFSYAQMVRAYPSAGSVYTYVNKSVQPHVGFLAGWVILLDYLLMPMGCYLMIGVYVNVFFPAIPVSVTVIVAAALTAFINIIGIKTASIVDTIIVAAQIGFTILLLLLIIKYVSGGGGTGDLLVSEAIYNPVTFDPGNILMSSAALCVSFVGFDAVTTMAEETKDPDRVMGKAVIGVTVGAGIAFIITAYFTQIAWPAAYLEIEDVDSGIFELFPVIGQDWLGTVFFITDNCGTFICAMASMAAVSRILFSMGRDNILPKKFFGKLSPRFQTPVNNILLTTGVAMSALFYQNNLLGAISLISFGAVVGFFMVNLSVVCHYYVKLKMRGGKNTFKYLVMPLLGMIALAAVFVNIDNSAKLLGCVWLALGVVYLAFKTRGFKTLPPEMTLEEE